MTDKKRPLRDRLFMMAAGYMDNDLIIETVDELDRLSQHREATGCPNTADLNRIADLEKERDVLRECLKTAVSFTEGVANWIHPEELLVGHVVKDARVARDKIDDIKHKAGIK
ncbi:MAG: hypothetical protein ACE5FH_13260 [Candidatus Zixiibacteriota bacterium]